MSLNKTRIALIVSMFIACMLNAQEVSTAKKGWSVRDPFVHDVFIENAGQFSDYLAKNVGDKVLYYTHKGQVYIYFSPTSFTFEHDSCSVANPGADLAGDDDAKISLVPVFMHVTWDGANANPTIEVQDEATGYFTYNTLKNKTGNTDIRAHAWKKIIYHNLYNNIDVAFYYTADKKGLEYEITVHPGGDISQVKMRYSKDANLGLINQVLHIVSPCATLDNSAPIAKDETGLPVSSSFSIHKNIVSFTTTNYDKSKALVIDPTYTAPLGYLAGTNKAYDLQYDLAGNVYVMGAGDKTEFELNKFGPAGGAPLWTYTNTFPAANQLKAGYNYYGGFTTDNRSGSSYISEGLDYKSATGCAVVKVNAAGTAIVNFAGNTDVDEIWKMAFDYCDNQIIIGAGEGSASANASGATMDTNLTAINPVNVLNAPAGSTHHDIAMITFDGVGKCYFATTEPAAGGNAGYSNKLLQMPSATLAPSAYMVSDASLFIETASVPYYPSLPSGSYIYCGNGFNGLIADLNLVATYDGNKLRTWTPASGAPIDSVIVSANTQMSGGIALDCEDNIYVGNANQVSVYSKTLALVNTIALTSAASTDSIYDLHIAPDYTLYACGNGFVSATPVTIPKMVTTTSTSPTGCGCTGTASATVCDNYPFTYSWSNGATTSSLSGLCPGKYLLTVKDQSCTPRQDTATVSITGSGSVITSITATPVQCFGQTTGTATASISGGTAPYTYTWNNANTNPAITGLAAGNYTCVVKDAGGCVDTLKDSVIQPKLLTLATNPFPATCWYKCDGQATVVPNGGTNPYAYAWSNGGSGAFINNLCVNTNYTVIVTDGHGCKDTAKVTITDPPPVVTAVDSMPALCGQANGSAGLTSVTGGTPTYTYLWNTGATTSSINNVNADVYQVIITDKNSCKDTVDITVPTISGDSAKILSVTDEKCFGDAIGTATATVWGGTAPYTYTWQTTNPVQTSLTATGLIAGSYTFSVTDSNGCIFKTYATITQPTPVVVIAPPDTICINQTGTLTATASGGTGPYTYVWNGTTSGSTFTANPTLTTVYSVKATDANGCTGDTTSQIVVRPPLIVVAGPPTSMCPGGSVTLTATGSGGDNILTYTWAPAAGLSATTGVSVVASPTVTTVYTVTLTDACKTPDAVDSVKIIVYPLPVVNFKADTLQGCVPLCVTFTDLTTVTGGTDTAWDWNFGDGTGSNSQNPKHCYTKPGTYTVSLTVYSNHGCPATFTINNYITVYSFPIPDFSFTPDPGSILDPTIYFTDHSTDAYGIINWVWQFGDETDTAGLVKDPQHTYADTGWYCVNLAVTNLHGCTADTTECLYIAPFFVIYVPNAFTPNGNGTNDYFTAKGVGILDFQMWIFDRWGQQLYYTNQMNPGWNGIVQGGTSGTQAQEDTYVWLIEATDVFHKQHRLVGRVTLIK